MKRYVKVMGVAVAMTMAMSVTAFAAGWEHNDTGWWYATNDAKTEWHHDGWQWVDGNNDGTAECYYFDSNGYILANTTTPDGYTVNGDGAWVENGVVKTQATGQASAGNEQQTTDTTDVAPVANTYNEDGISNIAIDMLNSTRAENAAKYGESRVLETGYSTEIDYANGFSATYEEYTKTGDTAADISTPDRITTGYPLNNMFNHVPAGGTSADCDTVEASVRALGYMAYNNGNEVFIDIDPYQIMWRGWGYATLAYQTKFNPHYQN